MVRVAVSIWHGVKDPPLLKGVMDAVGVPPPAVGATVVDEMEAVPAKPTLIVVMVAVKVPTTPGT